MIMKEGTTENCCEQQASRIDIVTEVKGYHQTQHVYTVNRDGDLFFIECPECHTTDINAVRVFGCRKCHTRFSLYAEDGIDSLCVETESGTVTPSDNEIKLLQLKKGDYFLKNHLPRNDGQIATLKAAFPEMKVIKLHRDFNKKSGKDAHDHERYRRYALIPLN